MSTICAKIVNRTIEFTDKPVLYSHSANVDDVLFSFDDEWEGFAKTAVFYREKEHPYAVLLDGSSAVIPHEVMQTDGRMIIGVFGVKGEQILTSEIVPYEIGIGVFTDGAAPDPTPELWQQILAELTSIRQTAEQMADDQTEFTESIQQQQDEFTTTMKNQQDQFITDQNADREAYQEQLTKEQNDFISSQNADREEYQEQMDESFRQYYQELKEISANFMTVEDVDRICGGEYDPTYDDYNAESISNEELMAILV